MRAPPDLAATSAADPRGLAGVREAVGRLAPVLLSNALVLFLLAVGRLSMLELLALVALETTGLQLVIGLGESPTGAGAARSGGASGCSTCSVSPYAALC